MRCQFCGSWSDTDICEGCLFINNHPEVRRNEQEHIFWLSIEIEAMERAAEETLFRRNEEDLKKGINKLNRRLKKRK